MIISANNIIYLILLPLFIQLIESAPDPLDELTINVNIGGTGTDATIKCGVKKKGTQLTSRIIGGNETEVNEYPWMVVMETGFQPDMYLHCGASVIADKWILTAAHCIYNKNLPEIEFILGEHDLNTEIDTNITKRVKPNWKTVHPKFGHTGHGDSYDIGLLRIPPIDLNIYTPICLPTQGAHYTGKIAWVYGWGKTSSGRPSNVLLDVPVPVVSDAEGYEKFAAGDIQHGHGPRNLTDIELAVMVFAGKPGNDTCQGDSGGPMSYANPNINGRHEQIGITSWGWGCGGQTPGVYTEVSALRSWIEDTISNNGGANFGTA